MTLRVAARRRMTDATSRKLCLLRDERNREISSCARIFHLLSFRDPMIAASQLNKEGMALRIDQQIYKVLEAEFKAGAGKMGGMVKTKLRSTGSGRLWEPHFRPDERLEDLELERRAMEFLYRDADNCVFMNPDDYEQEEIPATVIGNGEQFLAEGTKVSVEFFEGRPISVVLPPFMEAGWQKPHRPRTPVRRTLGRKQSAKTACEFVDLSSEQREIIGKTCRTLALLE